jgi:methionyl-tRNA formyltransferase
MGAQVVNIALLTKYNSNTGREYAARLIDNNINFVFITFGDKNEYEGKHEDMRCGGLWNPAPISDIKKQTNLINFDNINSKEFKTYIKEKEIDLGIQGDVGEIISEDVINLFPKGILNFHPGNLPQYRGCSAPEWQLYENKDIVCTCHYVDKGIDTGNIIEKKVLDLPYGDYHRVRASIYPEISKFLVDVINRHIRREKISSHPQDESRAIYRKYIGDDKIKELINLLNVNGK